ncbi:hypothetical protein [Segatella paludivivens]|uniref:hypothetical protein n=1 Tax=Segatella paludivivens TaxID=185294 RepID=UPI001EE17759|nr:hypothetical protein [Segatella paludivivens]
MKTHIIILTALFLSLQLNAQTNLQKDSLNIPVILVDGVEVQSLDSLNQDDIISVNVVKDKKLLNYFYPRMGGGYVYNDKIKKISSTDSTKISEATRRI